jgi:polyhydroxybutyrate depolymerase
MIPRWVLLSMILLGAANRLTALDQAHTVEHGGLTRTFKVHTPPSYDGATPLPVVLVLHGGGGSADDMIRWIKMDEKADEAGFITVYPNGYPAGEGRHVWNSGTCCEPATSSNADDIGFIRALLNELATVYRIDRRRIYATGASNGAMMAYTLASELSDRIAAIAPVAAAMGFDEIEATRAVPVLHFHGTADQNAPIAGGVGPNSLAGISHIPLSESIARWVKHDGCPTVPTATELPDREDDGTRVRREVYGPCQGRAEVILYVIEGGGHTWPGRPDLAEWYLHRTEVGGIEPDPRTLEVLRRCGRASRDIAANDIIWEFFSRHALEDEPAIRPGPPGQ